MKNCTHCRQSFEVTDSDRAFYARIQVPESTHCPRCRLQRRMIWRNENALYRRDCDLCQKTVVAVFPVDSPFPVYCAECWWSDRWDPRSYGRDYDFSRPFFEQFRDLLSVVPKSAVLSFNNENSDYNSLLAYSRNTYMSPGSHCMEDCFYCRKSQYCTDCVASHFLDHCELVAYGVNVRNCYHAHHLLNCRNCSDSAYLTDCSNCKNCFMCSGLNGAEYHFKNQAYSPEEYARIREAYAQKTPEQLKQEYKDFRATQGPRSKALISCENSSGNYLYNSKNAVECYDCFDVEDSKYLNECETVKDSMDLYCHDKNIELCYELCTGGDSNFNLKFSMCGVSSPNSTYLHSCFYLSDSFGCDGFHSRTQHCILNKACSPEEYEVLKVRIIEHMKSTGEWGEFFPMWLSPFAYNETVAQDYFPLSREQVEAAGLRWREKSVVTGSADALSCSSCSKPYRIIAQEKAVYEKIGAPLPSQCWDCLNAELIAMKAA